MSTEEADPSFVPQSKLLFVQLDMQSSAQAAGLPSLTRVFGLFSFFVRASASGGTVTQPLQNLTRQSCLVD